MYWENLAVDEIEFYKNKNKHFQQIEDRLEEIEAMNYIFPVGYFDFDTGLFRVSGRSVEDQVAQKVDTEKSTLNLKNKLIERCNRIEIAFSQLEEYEVNLIKGIYLQGNTKGLTERKVREVVRALRKFYRFIMLQKYQIRKSKEAVYLADKQMRVEQLRNLINN